MKYFLIALLLVGCSSTKQPTPPPPQVIHDTLYFDLPYEPARIHDTVTIVDPAQAKLLTAYKKRSDSLFNIVILKNDSLFNERYKIERVRYYCKIVQRVPSQNKFLLGWVLRAIKD